MAHIRTYYNWLADIGLINQIVLSSWLMSVTHTGSYCLLKPDMIIVISVVNCYLVYPSAAS